MERLTVKWADKVYDTFDPVDIVDNEYSKANYNKILTKLGDYEDLEEQGRLIKLPCKVGTDIYYILGIPNETPCTIDSCVFELSDIHEIGKTLFLTREEAEAKLKELRGSNE
jgi:hypothetical protein